ncbi:MAG: hypothetical protein NVS2B15_19670 [Pseudarthrobacter sp.]
MRGNSTQPHVHAQVSDSTVWHQARGVPLAFRNPDRTVWVPDESEIVKATLDVRSHLGKHGPVDRPPAV